MAKGACNCGAVAFEINAALEEVYVCHCSICRRATGVHGIAVAVVENSDFTWLSGEASISTYRKPDCDWQCWFCSLCGSPLPGANDPERTYVPVGLLTEGDENLKVAHHMFVGSKAPWCEIGDAGVQHEERIS